MSGGAAAAFVRSIVTDPANRERDDFHPTPPEGTEALLAVETFDGSIWEPACGAGDMSRVLEAHGHEVYSSDLIDRGYGDTGVDFLLDYRTRANNVVTNPPFKLDDEFVRHALGRTDRKVAFLLPLARLRRKWYATTPLARVWVFSWRLKMWRNGVQPEGQTGGMIDYAWYVWELPRPQGGGRGAPTPQAAGLDPHDPNPARLPAREPDRPAAGAPAPGS